VPYEIVLEAREVIFNPFEPDEQTIAAITSKDHKATAKAEANSHVVKVDESTAALMSAKPETAKGAGQLRRAVRVREGHCSWCYKKNIHVCTEQSYITRNIWQCQGCLQRTLKCRNPTCQDMARGLVGYDSSAGCANTRFPTGTIRKQASLHARATARGASPTRCTIRFATIWPSRCVRE